MRFPFLIRASVDVDAVGDRCPREGFRLTGLEPVCPECGSWICGTPRDGVVRVRGGTLDDTYSLRPTKHIWTGSNQPWLKLPEGDEVFEVQPAE